MILTYGSAMVVFFILTGVTVEPKRPPVEEQRKIQEFSKLEITDATYENGVIKVIGTTDLPSGSQLHVDVKVAGRPATATYIGVNTEVKVENGSFMATLVPSGRPEFAQGPHIVTVMFTPRGQSEAVLNLVGKNGEQLKGNKTREFHGFKVMETTLQVDLQIEVPSYPMVNPDSYPEGSPERAFAEFLSSWQKKDWNRMVKFTQKTWRNERKGNPAEMLEAWYGLRDLLGAEIIKARRISDVTRDITATLHYAIGSKVKTSTITARVIKETAPYSPSPKGEWGVNPLSTLKEK